MASEHILKISSDINIIWDNWKKSVLDAAEFSIGKVKKSNRYRKFWDNELDIFIKSTREINRLKRIHDKTHDCNSETGKILSDTYRVRKTKVQEAIKRKANALKLKEFHNKSVSP